MKLKIQKDTKTQEVKDVFAQEFPGLKLEFVRNEHGSGEGSRPEDLIHNNVPVSELNKAVKECEINLDTNTRVAEVESAFSNKAGLNVQVFRQAGRIWIETVNTDQWTLESQMEASHD
jgi:hypothetical protein